MTLNIRAAMEAYALACQTAIREMRPRPEMPQTLRGADLTDADLTGAYLMGAYLMVANLTRANLTVANLTDADLTDADLTGAYLTDANLMGANLMGANLMGADLMGGVTIKDWICVGPIGSRRSQLVLLCGSDGIGHALTGCFRGTLDEFTAAVEKTHGANEHGDAYRAAVALARLRFARLLTPAITAKEA